MAMVLLFYPRAIALRQIWMNLGDNDGFLMIFLGRLHRSRLQMGALIAIRLLKSFLLAF